MSSVKRALCVVAAMAVAIAGLGAASGAGAPAPAGESGSASLAVGSHWYQSCAIQDDQTVACSGFPFGERGALWQPGGQYSAIAARYADHQDVYSHTRDTVCGVRVDGILRCWGDMIHRDFSPSSADVADIQSGSVLGEWPIGRFTAVALGQRHGCAIRVGGAMACWGDDYGEAGPPEGRYLSVSSDYRRTCAIRDDQAIACWGPPFLVDQRPPTGQFSAVAAGNTHACAIRVDRTLACWGRFWPDRPVNPPEGEFTAVASSYNYSCAIRADQTIACWHALDEKPYPGYPYPFSLRYDRGEGELNVGDFGQADAPPGRFTALAASPMQACAESVDGEVVCWGLVQTEPYNLFPRFQAVYAVPDGAEAVPGRQQQIAQWISRAQEWFRNQTGGLHPLFERDRNGDISVPIMVQDPDHPEYKPPPTSRWNLGVSLESQASDEFGFNTPLVFFVEWPPGTTDYLPTPCGSAGVIHASVYLIPGCQDSTELEVAFVVAHEVIHLLGAVEKCAPNSFRSTSHLGNDNTDIMAGHGLQAHAPGYIASNYYRLEDVVLDPGRDDYYGHGRDDCWDIARHPLLGME